MLGTGGWAPPVTPPPVVSVICTGGAQGRAVNLLRATPSPTRRWGRRCGGGNPLRPKKLTMKFDQRGAIVTPASSSRSARTCVT